MILKFMKTNGCFAEPSFIWEIGESGDENVYWNKTLNCYPNYTNGLYSENNLSNTKPNNKLNILFVILV